MAVWCTAAVRWLLLTEGRGTFGAPRCQYIELYILPSVNEPFVKRKKCGHFSTDRVNLRS